MLWRKFASPERSALNLPKAAEIRRWLRAYLPLQPHPDPTLRSLWSWAQWAILVLPLSMLLGGVSVLLISLILLWAKFRPIAAQPINRGWLALSGLLLLSAIAAHSPPDAYLGLFNFIPYFWVFAAFSLLVRSPVELRQLAWLIVLGSVPVTVIGLAQMVGLWLGWQQVLHIRVLWVVIDWVIDFKGTPPGRMAATFGYANILANYLVMTLAIALGLWLEKLTQLGHWKSWRKLDPAVWWPLGGLTLVVGLNAIALIFTNSRNAWGIAAIAGLAYALYLGWRWLVAAVGLVVGIVLGAAFAPLPLQTWLRFIVPAFFWARLTDQLYPDRPVPTLRLTQWQFAWHLTQERPWLGWGLRNFSPLYQAKTQFLLGHPHNLGFMLLCETGIPATLGLVGLVGWVVASGSQALFSASPTGDRTIRFIFILTFLCNTLFNGFDVTLFDARINILGWVLLAGIWGSSRGDRQISPIFAPR